MLVAARTLAKRAPDRTFTPAEVITELQRSGSRYRASTIRTHVVSRMCINAPEHHAVVYADLERVTPDRYRLVRQ